MLLLVKYISWSQDPITKKEELPSATSVWAALAE